MALHRTSIHGQWSSRWIFILAATGSAVGLGNIWRFPYLAGENGGAIFVLMYLICVLLVGLPVFMAEIMLGRRGRQSPVNTLRTLVKDEEAKSAWIWIGWLGVLSGFFILSYYSVIAGWTMAYIYKASIGAFQAINAGDATLLFTRLLADPSTLLGWHSLFMLLTIAIISRGIKSGLELAVQYLMPTLFILLLLMVGYAVQTEQFITAMKYLFVPDFTILKDKNLFNDIFLAALGQAFFSLSIGMGAMMVYGSYLHREASILGTSCGIVLADTLVAILAGIAIFPIVFSYGMQPAQGAGLIFIALPIAFGKMAYGALFGGLFFFLLMVAALTSAISLLEPIVSWLVESKGLKRTMAAFLAGGMAWLLGILSALSFNHWAFDFSFAGKKLHNGIFDILDSLTASIMLPLGGMLIAIFAAWIMTTQHSQEEFNMSCPKTYRYWRFAARYIAPSGILLILLHETGIF